MPPRPARPAAKLPPATLKKLTAARAAVARQDLKAAVNLYKEALAAHPESPEIMGALGFLIGMMGRIPQAISMLERALAVDPDSSDLRYKIAKVHTLGVEPDKALVHLEPVTEAEPRRLDALVLAAQCCERLNRLDEARGYAERAIAVRRNDPEANLFLAQIDARQKRYDEARARLEKLAAKSNLIPELHHQALTELGFVLDKQSEYDAAYDAFDRAGREIAETPLVKRVDTTVAFKRLDAYRGRVTRELVGRFAGTPFKTPAPAFLVGFPRSGTTMTEQVMAAHPDVITSDEKPFIDRMGRSLIKGAPDPFDIPARLAKLDAPRVEELRGEYWAAVKDQLGVSADEVAGRVFVDKLPLNIIDLPMINTIFPDAKVIVALRDPRDVCLSAFMQWFAPNPAMVQLLSLHGTAHFYAAVMRLYLEVRDALTMPLLEVRYEDTVTNLEPQARRIIDHLGLPWHDDLLRFHEKAKERSIRTPSYAAVTEQVHTRAIARWKNYEHHYGDAMAEITPYISEFGYA